MTLAETLTVEITGLAQRLESRTRRNKDADIEKAAALLRLLNEVLAADERKRLKVAARQGRLN